MSYHHVTIQFHEMFRTCVRKSVKVRGLDLLSQRHLPDTVNLDLVQPAAFLAGSIFTQAHPR